MIFLSKFAAVVLSMFWVQFYPAAPMSFYRKQEKKIKLIPLKKKLVTFVFRPMRLVFI